MSVLFYTIFIALYTLSLRISALWNAKARQWVKGRKDIFERLAIAMKAQQTANAGPPNVIWFHCASLGEFEQGRPVLEALRSQFPDSKFLLTFFSPSGYEVQKNYPGAEYIFYLPADFKSNAQRFMDIVNPSLVVIVKYDFWYHYLNTIHKKGIPLLLISAIFRSGYSFFKWYGTLQRKLIPFFTHIFLQDGESKELLDKAGLDKASSVAGDTRFDRVIEIADKFKPLELIEAFCGNSKMIVAGSTWKEDEEILQNVFDKISDPSLKLIIAPHEISAKHVQELVHLFPGATLFSEFKGRDPGQATAHKLANVLIIDNVGMLSKLYHYGYITYVGGGYTRDGIHNILEAAVYGKPVLFGPNYYRYREAVELIEQGGAQSFTDAKHLENKLTGLLTNENEYHLSCEASKSYVSNRGGATAKIVHYIKQYCLPQQVKPAEGQ